MYYWVGLQLLARVIFFGVSSLDRDINLVVSVVLLSLIGGMHGVIRPFKNEIKNYQEQILIINLHSLFAVALYSQNTTNTVAINVLIGLAAVHSCDNICSIVSEVTRNKRKLHI